MIFPYNSLYTQAVAYITYFELGEPVSVETRKSWDWESGTDQENESEGGRGRGERKDLGGRELSSIVLLSHRRSNRKAGP